MTTFPLRQQTAFSCALVRELTRRCPSFVPGTILDIGCAHGWGTRALAYAYPTAQVLGVDIDPVAVTEAAAITDGVAFQTISPGVLPHRADLLVLSNVCEHLTDWQDQLAAYLAYCDGVAALLVPYDEDLSIDPGIGHVARFSEETFPLTVAGLVRTTCVPVRVHHSAWYHDWQLLVLYQRDWTVPCVQS
jgi:trans-aconitate methyltransferase